MPYFVAHRSGTNETCILSRDPAEIHPAWVHDQFNSTSEPNLQGYLDECERVWHADDYGQVDIYGLELVADGCKPSEEVFARDTAER